MSRIGLAALVMAVAAVTAFAAGGDNVTPLPDANKSSPSGTPPYFEGTWVGAWPSYREASVGQDVTVRIERGAKEGVFIVDYSWGASSLRSGNVPPGSVRAKGREEGDRFVFKWTNKQGRDVEITLQKHKDDVARARIEKSGPTAPGERPYNETYLNRK